MVSLYGRLEILRSGGITCGLGRTLGDIGVRGDKLVSLYGRLEI